MKRRRQSEPPPKQVRQKPAAAASPRPAGRAPRTLGTDFTQVQLQDLARSPLGSGEGRRMSAGDFLRIGLRAEHPSAGSSLLSSLRRRQKLPPCLQLSDVYVEEQGRKTSGIEVSAGPLLLAHALRPQEALEVLQDPSLRLVELLQEHGRSATEAASLVQEAAAAVQVPLKKKSPEATIAKQPSSRLVTTAHSPIFQLGDFFVCQLLKNSAWVLCSYKQEKEELNVVNPRLLEGPTDRGDGEKESAENASDDDNRSADEFFNEDHKCLGCRADTAVFLAKHHLPEEMGGGTRTFVLVCRLDERSQVQRTRRPLPNDKNYIWHMISDKCLVGLTDKHLCRVELPDAAAVTWTRIPDGMQDMEFWRPLGIFKGQILVQCLHRYTRTGGEVSRTGAQEEAPQAAEDPQEDASEPEEVGLDVEEEMSDPEPLQPVKQHQSSLVLLPLSGPMPEEVSVWKRLTSGIEIVPYAGARGAYDITVDFNEDAGRLPKACYSLGLYFHQQAHISGSWLLMLDGRVRCNRLLCWNLEEDGGLASSVIGQWLGKQQEGPAEPCEWSALSKEEETTLSKLYNGEDDTVSDSYRLVLRPPNKAELLRRARARGISAKAVELWAKKMVSKERRTTRSPGTPSGTVADEAPDTDHGPLEGPVDAEDEVTSGSLACSHVSLFLGREASTPGTSAAKLLPCSNGEVVYVYGYQRYAGLECLAYGGPTSFLLAYSSRGERLPDLDVQPTGGKVLVGAALLEKSGRAAATLAARYDSLDKDWIFSPFQTVQAQEVSLSLDEKSGRLCMGELSWAFDRSLGTSTLRSWLDMKEVKEALLKRGLMPRSFVIRGEQVGWEVSTATMAELLGVLHLPKKA